MKKSFSKVQDSGKRQSFDTGSVRDTAEGKGTPHLIAGLGLVLAKRIKSREVLLTADLIEGTLFKFSDLWQEEHIGCSEDCISKAINLTISLFSSYGEAMRRLAQHYENGAKKYDKNNWRKGQPVSRYFDSAMRHLWDYMDKKEDEDHMSALLWNLIAIVQTKEDVRKGILPQELDDFPFTTSSVFGEKK